MHHAQGCTAQTWAVQTYVVLCQKLGAELHVIFKIERPAGFELCTEAGNRDSIVHLLCGLYGAKLSLRVLRDGQTRRSPVAAMVVLLVHRGAGGSRLLVEVIRSECHYVRCFGGVGACACV